MSPERIPGARTETVSQIQTSFKPTLPSSFRFQSGILDARRVAAPVRNVKVDTRSASIDDFRRYFQNGDFSRTNDFTPSERQHWRNYYELGPGEDLIPFTQTSVNAFYNSNRGGYVYPDSNEGYIDWLSGELAALGNFGSPSLFKKFLDKQFKGRYQKKYAFSDY